MAGKISNFPRLPKRNSDALNCYTFQDTSTRLISLEIKKKRGSSVDLDIHHSKVPSSDNVISSDNMGALYT